MQKIETIIAALRNTEGGELILHVEGQKQGDRYLEYLDEFINAPLSNLTERGQLFVDTYVRLWLADIPAFKSFTDFIYINVKKSDILVTVDYNTKICSEIENISPSLSQIQTLLSKPARRRDARTPLIESLENVDTQSLHESRHVELKLFKDECMRQKEADDVAEYIWKNFKGLKFKHNLTSMSKVTEGGSYFVGVQEKPDNEKDYKSMKPEIVGFLLKVTPTELLDALRRKITSEVCVLQNGSFADPPDDLVDIKIHHVPETKPKRHLLEITVQYFDGIVFYDKKGPRSYSINVDGTVCRMDKSEWLDRLMRVPCF